jgi:thiol:disulfide interchange protein
MLLYAGATGSAWYGAVLLFFFALVRGLPLVLAGSFTGLLKDFKSVAHWQPWLEKVSGLALIVLGVGFVAQRFGDDTAISAVSIALLGALGWLMAKGFQGRANKEVGSKDQSVSLVETEFATPGMVCEGCAETLSRVLLQHQAVHEVIPDVKQKRVRVLYNPERATTESLRQRVEELGFM